MSTSSVTLTLSPTQPIAAIRIAISMGFLPVSRHSPHPPLTRSRLPGVPFAIASRPHHRQGQLVEVAATQGAVVEYGQQAEAFACGRIDLVCRCSLHHSSPKSSCRCPSHGAGLINAEMSTSSPSMMRPETNRDLSL